MKPIRSSRAICVIALTACITGFFAPSAAAQLTWSSTRIPALTPEQQEILSHQSIVYLDDGQGGTVKTLRIEGINVQVVNGAGSTQTQNGLGNLIVGYNELGNPNGDDRTGSHNISFGEANSFSSFGGLVGPNNNTISGPFASVSGGTSNTASGYYASVSGGWNNTASSLCASVSGGFQDTASSGYSSVSGGRGNQATGFHSSVSGGLSRSVSGSNNWRGGSYYSTN